MNTTFNMSQKLDAVQSHAIWKCKEMNWRPQVKRVLHTNIGIYPERGGPPSVIVNLAAAQARAGLHVAIASAASHASVRKGQREMLDQILGGSSVEVFEMPVSTLWGALTGAEASLPDGNWDLVHIHELWNPFDAAVAKAAQRRNIPYVVTMHGLLSKYRRRQRWLKKRIARALWVDRLLRKALFVQGLTRRECAEAQELVAGIRTVQIPNGCSSTIESAAALPLPPKITRLAGHRFLLSLSRLHPIKGVELLIPAFELFGPQNPDVDLVIAGPDYGSLAVLASQRSSSNLSRRIHLIGMATGSVKTWLLRNAEVFLLPSYDEGFSVAILEALNEGLPAIITPCCNFPEAIIAGAALGVQPTPVSIAEACRNLLSDPSLRARMGVAGKGLVQRNYAWDQIARLLLEVCFRESPQQGLTDRTHNPVGNSSQD